MNTECEIRNCVVEGKQRKNFMLCTMHLVLLQQLSERELREEVAREIEGLLCERFKYEKALKQEKNTISDGCYGVNGEHCDVLRQAANIARGK